MMDINQIKKKAKSKKIMDTLVSMVENGKRNALFNFSTDKNPKQLEVISSTNKIVIAEGGNRSGKTEVCTYIFCCAMSGKYPDWFPEESRISQDRALKGRIIVTDVEEGIKKVMTPKLEKYLYAGDIKWKHKNQQGAIVEYHMKNGNKFDVLTDQQENKMFEGWDGDVVLIDEPITREHFIATMRGLIDRGGRCFIGMTPIYEAWMDEELEDNENVDIIRMSMYDNKFLPEEEIEKFISLLDDDEKQARIYGIPLVLMGKVYKMLNRKYHVIPKKDFSIPPSWDYARVFGIDPHPSTPTAALWAIIGPDECIYFYRALWQGEMTVAELCNEIRKLEEGEKIKWRVIDPNIAAPVNNLMKKGWNLKMEFIRNGIPCLDGNDNLEYGENVVKEYLKHDTKKPMDPINRPKMYFIDDGSPGMKECIRQMFRYGIAKYDASERKETHKRIESNKHFPDVVRYIATQKPIARRKNRTYNEIL